LPRPKLPERTGRYNVGDVSARYRDAANQRRRFALRRETALRDGGGREVGRTSGPVMLNRGAVKQMVLGGGAVPETCVWGWNVETDRGKLSGWLRRSVLEDPPETGWRADVNPGPPLEGPPLVVDAVDATRKLAGLRFKNSSGEIPRHGNAGTHYSGRNPGRLDFVYLCFNVPNVVRGGVAKDSIPDGGLFVPALDDQARPIRQKMTMYRGGDLSQPVAVHFLYGRPADAQSFGWIAQANVGHVPLPGEPENPAARRADSDIEPHEEESAMPEQKTPYPKTGRVVAGATPPLAVLIGALSVWLAKQTGVPETAVSEALIFAVGAGITYLKSDRWMKGWQEYEKDERLLQSGAVTPPPAAPGALEPHPALGEPDLGPDDDGDELVDYEELEDEERDFELAGAETTPDSPGR